jgi:glycosyltransferase involved in cell wall biosynthesis
MFIVLEQTMKPRVIVDIQSLQGISRQRGIGRYTLGFCIAISKYCTHLDILLAYNTAMHVDASLFRILYEHYPHNNVVGYQNLTQTAFNGRPSRWRQGTAEYIFENAIEFLKPDVVHVCSMFEGLGEDNNVYSTHTGQYLRTCTFYDGIPLVHKNHYLQDNVTKDWYYNRLNKLLQCDFVFAISEASCAELLNLTNYPKDKVSSIGGGINEIFAKQVELEASNKENRAHADKFILYTGGIEYRKNIDNLLIAFSKVIHDVKLIVVCDIEEHVRAKYLAKCHSLGIEAGRVVFAGFVEDVKLRQLYEECELFVFPSWHEGLGLPVLEAMACGAPVVASRILSMQELIQTESALFDPYSPDDIAETIDRALDDTSFRNTQNKLAANTLNRFSWKRSAEEFGNKIQRLVDDRLNSRKNDSIQADRRQRLAIISPWPPAETGVADYSLSVTQMLSKYYDITVFAENFASVKLAGLHYTHDQEFHNLRKFDRRLYMLGGSLHHTHMIKFLQIYPGTVVAHDFFLGAFVSALDTLGAEPRLWVTALYESHGWPAVYSWSRDAADSVAENWPCNAFILKHANGVIVHSEHAMALARLWLGSASPSHWQHVPFLARTLELERREVARQALAIGEDELVFVTMGAVAATKNVIEILMAWEDTWRMLAQKARLHIVGNIVSGDYGLRVRHEVARLINLGARILLTDRVTEENYRRHLAAADIAIQLRSGSRGETSAALFDCLGAGLPTIVNKHGSACEVASDAVYWLSDRFTIEELCSAMKRLSFDQGLKRVLSQASTDFLKTGHSVEMVGPIMRDAIERFVKAGPRVRRLHLVDEIIQRAGLPSDVEEWREVAIALGVNEKVSINDVNRLFIEIPLKYRYAGAVDVDGVSVTMLLADMMRECISGWRVEPVFAISVDMYETASGLMQRVLGFGDQLIDPVRIRRCDIRYLLRVPEECIGWSDIKGWIQSRSC